VDLGDYELGAVQSLLFAARAIFEAAIFVLGRQVIGVENSQRWYNSRIAGIIEA